MVITIDHKHTVKCLVSESDLERLFYLFLLKLPPIATFLLRSIRYVVA